MAVIIRDCPHCPAGSSSFTIRWCGELANRQHAWSCSATCAACGLPVCFVVFAIHSPTSPSQYDGNIEPDFTIGQIWPARIATGAPPHTPKSVKSRYEEGEDAFSRGKWNSAVAMYRSALDIATKAMEGVPKGSFFDRLEWLHRHHAITPDIHAWATHVRVEGNAALHDPEEFDESDAKALRFFTEMFLRYVFELPGAVREFRGEPESKTPPMQKSG